MSTASPADLWTIQRLITWTRGYFERCGIESPRLCTDILLAHALGCERIQLYARFDQQPSESQIAAFRELVRQAADGAPIAYLTGSKEFFSLSFSVSPAVLIPRPETELLVERTIHFVRQAGRPARILDLCTGSGCVAIALAKHLPECAIFASDISEAAMEIARQNAARHNLTERIELRTGDLFAAWQTHESEPFDLVVSNPPYIASADAPSLPKTVREFEPQVALFAEDGLAMIRRVVDDAPRWLNDSGQLLMEVGHAQSPIVRQLLSDAGWTDVRAYKDTAGIERVLHARRSRSTAQ